MDASRLGKRYFVCRSNEELAGANMGHPILFVARFHHNIVRMQINSDKLFNLSGSNSPPLAALVVIPNELVVIPNPTPLRQGSGQAP